MSYWYCFESDYGWQRCDTKAAALACADDHLKVYRESAQHEEWRGDTSSIAVYRADTLAPTFECDGDKCDWLFENAVPVYRATETDVEHRPEPPAGLSEDELDDWFADNWPYSRGTEMVCDYKMVPATLGERS